MPVVEQSGMRLEYSLADEQPLQPNGRIRLRALTSPPHINNRVWFAYRLEQGEWIFRPATREVAGIREEQYVLELDVPKGAAVLSYLAFVRRSGITVPRGADSLTSGEAQGLKELTVDVNLSHHNETSVGPRTVDEHRNDSEPQLPREATHDNTLTVAVPDARPPAIGKSVKDVARVDQTAINLSAFSAPNASVTASPAPEVTLAAQLGAVTNNHVPLVKAIRALPDINQAQDVARLTEDNWKSLIQSQNVGVPPDTLGANADEKAQNYARKIVREVEAAFPTRFLAERLGTSPVATLLKQTSFDLKTYPERFFKQNPAAAQALTPEDHDQLRSLQRLHRLISSAQSSSATTSLAEEAIALTRKGVRSAYQIARMDQKAFAQQNLEIFSEERAKEVHQQALRTNAVALALLGEHGAGLNRTGMHALPRLDTAKQKSEADAQDEIDGIPDWENLFGGFDFCACQECGSAHGPAAYFVDVLKFLSERMINETSNRSVKDALFDRRPDLGDIELSCDNTNTVLPLIDLVNEVLENAVAPPLPFAPFDLAPSLEADLNEAVASADLAAAFNPPLQSGTRIETLDAGTRWRIWDEPFAYTIVKENDVLNVVARSRQTTGSTEDLRTTPQYRNSAAYEELSRAVYPWSLPFSLPGEEASAFLKHLGVPRRDLIEALRPEPHPFDPNSPVMVQQAVEELGLSDDERKIIVDEVLEPPRQLEDFWGSAPLSVLSIVRELLDRSSLSFAELEELVSTRFINPDKTIEISARPDIATCDTTKLQINGLTAEVLSRSHRFVRLWRKLGWTIAETDKSICAFAPDPEIPSLTNEVVVRLAHLSALRNELRISCAQALAFWKPIDTAEPASLYKKLFDNPAIFKSQDEDFRLTPNGKELVHSERLLLDHAAALQAVFRLTSASFVLLVTRTDGRLTLDNLSFLYRHALLARLLGMSIQDLLTAQELTGIDPFRADQSQHTIRFVGVVKAIRKSGFDFAELDYLIRHKVNPTALFVPTESSLSQTLAQIRTDLQRVDAQSEEEKQKLVTSAIIDRVSSALALPADVTSALLTRVGQGEENAMHRFLALSAIPDKSCRCLATMPRPNLKCLRNF